ncbi:MAG: hypothetical protein KDA24_01435 [Deltaproteobacteria bacterium]|nr:hypothetical protein [Deltaproteobacteria bacterium]
MRATLTSLLVLVSSSVLAGCPGSLLICGVNWDECGDTFGTGDDDDDGVVRDFANYDGVEYLNIDWDAEAEADGQFDCEAEFRAQGPRTLLDDQNLCPDCDEIWTVTLVAENGVDDCLGQGTGIDAPASYERKIGLIQGEGVSFEIHRSAFSRQSPLGSSPNEPLVFAGVGAFQGADYTWSGIETPVENDNLGYVFFFSGEGNF